MEPYFAGGTIDLHEPYDDDLTPFPTGRAALRSSSGLGTFNESEMSRRPVGDLERKTKAMLGVRTTPSSATRSDSTIPTKTLPASSVSVASPSNLDHHTLAPTAISHHPSSGSDHSEIGPQHVAQSSNPHSEAEREVEYVRHTDAGGMRVELPPLYTDVPRREGDN